MDIDRTRRQRDDVRDLLAPGRRETSSRSPDSISDKPLLPEKEAACRTPRAKTKLINRVRRIRGQMEGVEKMLDE